MNSLSKCAAFAAGLHILACQSPIGTKPSETPVTIEIPGAPENDPSMETDEIQTDVANKIKKAFVTVAIQNKEDECYSFKQILDQNAEISLDKETAKQYEIPFIIKTYETSGGVPPTILTMNPGPYDLHLCLKGAFNSVESTSSSLTVSKGDPFTIPVYDSNCSNMIVEKFFCTPVQIETNARSLNDEEALFIIAAGKSEPPQKFKVVVEWR